MHKFRYHNHLESYQTSRSLVEYDVGYVSPRFYPVYSFLLSRYKDKFFISALLWEAKFSRDPIKDATRWWGSELQMKIVCSTRFEDIDTDIGKCFPMLYLYLGGTLLGHKLIQNRISLNFWTVFVHSCTWYRKSPACQKEFLGFDIRSSDRHFSLVHCM